MDTPTNIGLGEYLRSEREKRNITIEQVASATKINIKLLHALEGDNYELLPAKPFVRGFVTSYTRYVGLDHREVLTRFDSFLDEKSGKKFIRPADAPHIFVEKEGQTENNKTALTIVMVGFIIVGVLAAVLLKPLRHKRHAGKEKPAVTNEEIVTVVPPPADGSALKAPAATAPAAAPAPVVTPTPTPSSTPTAKPTPVVTTAPVVAPAPKPTPTPTPKPSPTPSPKPTATATPTASTAKPTSIPDKEVKHRLVVRSTEDSWVKYQVDDQPIKQYTLRKGQTIFVRARSSIRFRGFNPKGIEISYDNKQFVPLGNDAKTLILPKEVEEQFRANPFLESN